MLNFTQSKREREIEERKGKRASEMKRVITYILVIFLKSNSVKGFAGEAESIKYFFGKRII